MGEEKNKQRKRDLKERRGVMKRICSCKRFQYTLDDLGFTRDSKGFQELPHAHVELLCRKIEQLCISFNHQ